MAVLTNAMVISEDTGMKLENADMTVLGTAKKVGLLMTLAYIQCKNGLLVPRTHRFF